MTYDQRQTLQIISQSRDSFHQIGNNLSQDSTNNLQIIGLPINQLGPFDVDVGKGSFGREGGTGYSDVGCGDGARDGLKSGMSVGSGYVRVL